MQRYEKLAIVKEEKEKKKETEKNPRCPPNLQHEVRINYIIKRL